MKIQRCAIFLVFIMISGFIGVPNSAEDLNFPDQNKPEYVVEPVQEDWKFRQLPNVTITSGPDSQIMVIDTVVLDNEGIYFVLGQSRGYGRYSGPWALEFGSLDLNVRDYIGTDDLSSIVLLAKLDFTGDWEWVHFLNKRNSGETSLIKWSNDKLAISGSDVWHDNSSYYDFVVFSSRGEALDYFKLDGNTHPDYNSGYIASTGGKHYFTEQITSANEGKHGIDLCFEDFQNLNSFYTFYSIDTDMNVDLIFSTSTPPRNEIFFHNDIFTFHLQYSEEAHKIYYDEGCNIPQEYVMMKTNSQSEISISNFTDAQGNPNNSPPVYVGKYDPTSELIEPIALMSHGCVIHDAINVKKFEKNECIIATSNWASYHLMYSLLDSNWKWGEELITLIDLDYTAAFDEQRNNSPYSGSTVILNLDDLQNTTVNYISGEFSNERGIDYTRNSPSIASFYHSVHGVSFSYDDAKDGTDHITPNAEFLNVDDFQPFGTIPYNSGNHQIQEWYSICDCDHHEFNSSNGFFFTYGHTGWDTKPQASASDVSGGGVVPSRLNNIYDGEMGNLVRNIWAYSHWNNAIPYIYDENSGLQGVPVRDSDSIAFLLAKGRIAEILKPFSQISDIGGIESYPVEVVESDSNNDNEQDNNQNSGCELSINHGASSTRTCALPTDDIDWDGVMNSEDEDQDGDGRLDVSELSNTIQNNDPDTMDMSVITSPYSGTVHSLELTTADGTLEISFEYKVNIVEFSAHLPLVAYVNEDGSEMAPEDYSYTLSSSSQLDRLEDQMCYSPNLGELYYSFPRFPLWLENLTVDATLYSEPIECTWVERRSVDLLSTMMITDDMELANWKETIRYTISVTDTGQFSNNIEVKLPSHQGTQGKVWEVILNHGTVTQSDFAYPWNENLSISIPSPPSAENQNQESQQPSIIPSFTSGWSFIADVSQGQIDCSGYSSTVTDNLDDLYQQNDIEYNSLISYHEYRITDDYVSISCSGSLEFEEAMDGDEIEFCIYLFLDGEREDSGCDTGSFVAKSVNGQRQTVDEVIDDFNQDLDDLEQQWQNDLDDLFSPPESSASGSSEDVTFDDLFMLLIIAALIGGVAQSIQKKNKEKAKSKKKRSSKRNRQKEFDRQPSSYVEPEIPQPNQEIVEEESYDTTEFYGSTYDSEYAVTETGLEEANVANEVTYNQPPFSFSGEIDEHGWEVCEYPRSSGVWWWKDYDSEQWMLWE